MRSDVARVSGKESPAFRHGENVNLGITQLQVWDLMKNGVIAYMSNEFTYAVRVTDLNHLLMVDRVERHSKEVEEWESWK